MFRKIINFKTRFASFLSVPFAPRVSLLSFLTPSPSHPYTSFQSTWWNFQFKKKIITLIPLPLIISLNYYPSNTFYFVGGWISAKIFFSYLSSTLSLNYLLSNNFVIFVIKITFYELFYLLFSSWTLWQTLTFKSRSPDFESVLWIKY